ncbi:triple gene block 3 [Daphne virus S]|uniref:Movement protein TGBp3 n=1 Tax=Daphne virus S TaxID=216614 RepID=Q5GR20_9VIRU|nr:triple gene block 3 [Daphne virus S]CAF04329.1 triple gene block 3 [Daphne virus S]
MSLNISLSLLHVGLIVFTVLCILGSLYLSPSGSQCVIIITGESIKILNCEMTPAFLEYAKGLHVERI